MDVNNLHFVVSRVKINLVNLPTFLEVLSWLTYLFLLFQLKSIFQYLNEDHFIFLPWLTHYLNYCIDVAE